MSDPITEQPTITGTWTLAGAPSSDLTDWLGTAPHTWQDDQLVLQTPDGPVRPPARLDPRALVRRHHHRSLPADR